MAAGNEAPRFISSERATADVLEARVLVAFTYLHGHPGVPGIAEGQGCPRCNAEKALDELVRRAEQNVGGSSSSVAGASRESVGSAPGSVPDVDCCWIGDPCPIHNPGTPAGTTGEGSSDPTLSCDALADDLMEALREHPAGMLSTDAFAQDGGRLQAAYNRLWDRVRGV